MNKEIEKINAQYKLEREDLERAFKSGEVDKKRYDNFTKQLDSCYALDIADVYAWDYQERI